MLKKVIDSYKRLLFNLVLTSPLFLFTAEYAYKLLKIYIPFVDKNLK